MTRPERKQLYRETRDRLIPMAMKVAKVKSQTAGAKVDSVHSRAFNRVMDYLAARYLGVKSSLYACMPTDNVFFLAEDLLFETIEVALREASQECKQFPERVLRKAGVRL